MKNKRKIVKHIAPKSVLTRGAAKWCEKHWRELNLRGYCEIEPTTGQVWITIVDSRHFLKGHFPFDWLYEKRD